VEGKRKQPHAIAAADDGLLAFAGVWENWRDPETGEWLRSVAIVTTEASESVRPLHHRMPVIVAPADRARWLGEVPVAPEALAAIMRASAAPLRTWSISTRVNRAGVDGPENLAPLERVAPRPE
jgi:putative SOS response-associated peptidase YedK